MRRFGWLSRQPRAFQDQVLALSELRHFPPGATIYNIGDVALDIWGLVEGELSVFLAPEAAAPFLVHIAKPGWWVGDTALIVGRGIFDEQSFARFVTFLTGYFIVEVVIMIPYTQLVRARLARRPRSGNSSG